MNIAVFASGNGSNFEAIVEATKQGIIEGQVELLICDQKNAYVLERAKKAGVPSAVFSPKSFNSKELYEQEILDLLQAAQIDLIALAGYMRIVGPTLLTAYPEKILNIHPALLPAYPGRNGIRDAYEDGAVNTGVTIHYVDEGIDSGPIIAQELVRIEITDNVATLEEKVHRVEHRLYPTVIQSEIVKLRKAKQHN